MVGGPNAQTYEIVVTATDFMGTTSDPVIIFVLKKSAPAPLLTFSPPTLSIFRDQAALAKVIATFSNCPVEKGKLIFKWTKETESGSSTPIDVSIFDQTGAQLYIAPGTLVADVSYRIGVTAYLENDPSKTSQGVFSIEVLPRALVASIRGGALIAATTFRDLVLDARDSMDPDYTGEDDDADLEFEWSCTIMEGGIASPCRRKDGSEIAFSHAAMETIPTSDLFPTEADPYVFSVQVSKGLRTPAVFSMPVTLTVRKIPDVTVGSMSGEMQADGSVKINPADQLVVVGHCTVDAGTTMTLQWTFDPPIVAFETIPDETMTGSNDKAESLFVAESQDQPAFIAGASYSVKLKCVDEYGEDAVSELALVINVLALLHTPSTSKVPLPLSIFVPLPHSLVIC